MAKNLKVKDRNIRVQIWDTAGQESFRAIARSYYKNTACALVVYDITEKKTFENVRTWLKDCKEMCNKDVLILLVANKTDLGEKRVISEKEGREFAEENGMIFFETSALNGNGIKEVFEYGVNELVDRLESGKMEWDANSCGVKIANFPNKEVEAIIEKHKKGCC